MAGLLLVAIRPGLESALVLVALAVVYVMAEYLARAKDEAGAALLDTIEKLKHRMEVLELNRAVMKR